MWLLLLSLWLLAFDGGDVDAGMPSPPAAPARWRWSHADGGWLDDAGVTDTLTMRVGEVAEVQLPRPIILMQCDEPLLELGATADTLLLKAVKAGRTRCGFWYDKQSWPHRTLDVTVTR
jgi:hypothetical protein